jgi:hypothetical protein
MSYRRWLALCGIASPLILVLGIVVGGDSPDTDDSADQVMSFYRSHLTSNRIAALMVTIAAVLLVLFVVRLRELLDTGEPGTSVFATAAFAGGVLGAAGLIIAAVVHFTLVDVADEGTTSAAQALNVLDEDTLIAAAVGLALLYFAAGIAILRGRTLPRWLGWAAVVIGVVSLAGPIGFFGALLGMIWLIVVGVLMFRQAEPTRPAVVVEP